VNDRAEAFRAADLCPRLEGLSENPASNSQGAASGRENAAQQTASESERANYEKNHCEPKRALKHALRSSENSIFEYWTASRFLQPSFARGSLRASVPRAAAFVAAMKSEFRKACRLGAGQGRKETHFIVS
jgi:hypothetical protein